MHLNNPKQKKQWNSDLVGHGGDPNRPHPSTKELSQLFRLQKIYAENGPLRLHVDF